jgi:hypothetical protein
MLGVREIDERIRKERIPNSRRSREDLAALKSELLQPFSLPNDRKITRFLIIVRRAPLASPGREPIRISLHICRDYRQAVPKCNNWSSASLKIQTELNIVSAGH